MKATVVGMVTPHVLKIIDLAKEAETGLKVERHVQDCVARTLEALTQQYNAPELLAAYVQGLQTAAEGAGRFHDVYAGVLRDAAAMAERELQRRQ